MKHAFRMLFLFSLCTACQKKHSLQYKEWSVGAPEAAKAALLAVSTEPATETVSYKNKNIQISRQLKDNVPVYGSFVKTIRDESGIVLIQANTDDEKKMKLLTLPEVGHRSYSDVLKESNPLFSKMEILKVERIVLLENNLTQFYTLVSVFDRQGTPYEVFFNDHNELVQLKKRAAEFSDVTASLYPEGPKLSQLTDLILKGISAEPAISNNQLMVTTESTKKITLTSGVLKFDPKDERFDQLQAFFYLDKALRWIKDSLKVDMSGRLNAVVWMGYPDKTNSAFYFQNKIRIGKGDDVTYSNLAQDASVVSHETFHAMIDRMARLPFEGEGGSLNEAFADFFTCLMLDRPYLGESSYLKGLFKRSLNNTSKLSEKTGGLYHDSLIISGTLWDIKEKFGTEKAKGLALETLIQLNPASDFKNFFQKIKLVGSQQLSADDLTVLHQVLANRGFLTE